jgi:uncharacterized protein YycO
MKRCLAILSTMVALALAAPLTATAAPTDGPVGAGPATGDRATTQRLVDQANALPVQADPKAGGGVTPMAAYGSYSKRKGVILVTSDFLKGLIPTGHAAIGYSDTKVIESVAKGVVKGAHNWNTSKTQAYQVTTRGTTAKQDAKAADWAESQLGKPYNYNYVDTGTRKKFYCSQLVWAAFLDNFGIDLNTWVFLNAVHPMELVNNDKVTLIYRKK